MTDTQAHPHPLTCEACQILDRSDGVEDGQIFTPAHIPVKSESRLLKAVMRTQDRVADQVTTFAGSLRFVYLHGVWFGVWILINVGLIGASAKFDKFPFGLLTMIVSLEAIFLSTFVMVSQNRQAARSDIRAAIDFENNVRAEIWAVHIGAKLGVDPAHVEEVVQGALVALKEAGA
jgi:uncharacterized membrane protein